jgi:chaperonin cofactor prefoldin
MANAGEHGTAGRASMDPIPEFRGGDSHGVADVHPVKVDMGMGPPPARRPAARPGATSGAAIATSAVLALLFGGAGAWAYERFLAQKRAEKPVVVDATSPAPGPESEIQQNLARLELRINGLSDQYKEVRARTEAIPKSAPSPDLAPLEQKAGRVDELSQQVDAIGKKLDPLPRQLAQSEQRLKDLDTRLDDLRKEMSTGVDRARVSPSRDGSTNRASASSPGDEAAEPPSSSEKVDSGGSTYEAGVSQFRDKQYRAAYVTFRKVLQSQPDDARSWYYAALSYGLTGGDWGRDAQVMATEGAAREKAGKPSRSEIDAAFAGLTKDTGKEWLDFYRQRAR